MDHICHGSARRVPRRFEGMSNTMTPYVNGAVVPIDGGMGIS